MNREQQNRLARLEAVAPDPNYRPWVYVDPDEPFVTLPDGSRVPTTEAWLADHAHLYRYIEVGECEPTEPADAMPPPAGTWPV